MTESYKNTFRGIMMDQHFPDAPFITFSKLNPSDEFNQCQNALVDSVMITTKCHWGYSYYPTEVGLMHPRLNKRDMVGELVSQARKTGIEAIAYYCFTFDNIAARHHSDWKFITADNNPAILRDLYEKYVPEKLITQTHINPWRWDMACINTGYRQYCLDQITELSLTYDFDTLFLDIFGISHDFFMKVCYCPSCLEEYSKQGLDPYSHDTKMRFALIKYWWNNWGNLLRDIKQILHKNKPDTAISINGNPLEIGWEVLQNVDWPYSEGAQNPHNSVILRSLGLNNPQCGISPGQNVYDIWPPNLARIWTSTVLAHGNRTFFFFMHGRLGDGSFEKSKYSILHDINKEVTNIQPYVKNANPIKAAAVYYNESTTIEAGTHNNASQQENNISSVINTFRSISTPCELLPNWKIDSEELNKYQLIIVPEQKCLSDEETLVLTRYVETGGNLLVTGDSGLLDNDGMLRSNFAMSELMGIDYLGISKEYSHQRAGGYLQFDKHPFFKNLPNKNYNMWGNFLKVKVRDAEIIGYISEPVEIETQDNYIGWRELPPGKKVDWPCVTVAQRGKGTVIYSVAPLAQYIHNGDNWPKVFIESITEAINLDWGVKWKGPSFVSEATFFKKDNHIIVHLLNQSIRGNEGIVVPIPESQLLLTKFKPTEARIVYPNNEILEIKEGVINIPPISIHTIVSLKLPDR